MRTFRIQTICLAVLFVGTLMAGSVIAGAADTISGAITIDQTMAKEIKPNAVLFITARTAMPDGKPGPVLAAKRVAPVIFPLKFMLGASDVMMGGPFQGKVFITARIKQGGTAGPAEPGDLEGSYVKNPVAVGTANVDLVIDKRY
ncbi:MAG: hypothetical protein HYV03_08455 [Deltaproteobacteria bacterium]|nr:hypothetical protein [Deltaproteobacteria bacterium]